MTALDHDRPADDVLRVRRFTVLADAEPGLLPRLIEPLAKRGLVPRRLEVVAEDATMRLSLSVELDGGAASLLGASLRAIVGVRTVLAEPA
ncbi:hypothetical protein [Elioraea tepidiphila]|jgi:hypothetical protein|uniref:hypothetical protein n=1 Tax=Elioraea tepidiphila TaxID=457934 RepID=UPI00037A8710|nr:hypothetical protein [Elioraea tepidiphila]